MQGRINRNAEYECGYLYIAWLEGKHCPDSYYKTEADISVYLFSDKKEFEMEALEYNREYFKHLYAGSRGIDAPAIHDAEEDEDIYEMYKNYHIIDNAPQYSIIVPYEEEMDLFEDIRGKYRMNGYVLSKSDLKTVHGIVVRVYASGNAGNFIKRHCHSLSFNGADSGWFIADMDDIYDEMTGLRTEEEGDDAYIL